MDTKRCNCCGSKMEIASQLGIFSHFICIVCRYEEFVQDDSVAAATLYEEDSDYSADLAVSQRHTSLIQWNHRLSLKYLSTLNGKTSVLDIGCFNGFFVRELIESGYDAHGIDFNEKALVHGQSIYNLQGRISNMTILQLADRGKSFDVITAFEVIEHLEDFPAFLRQATHLLNRDGVLILSTPNSEMLWRPSLDFPPHHLSRFSPEALKCAVTNLGLSVVMEAQQMSLFDLLRNYFGSSFRSKKVDSLRGGEFMAPSFTNVVRKFLNHIRPIAVLVLAPINWLLYQLGFRYIGQLVIAKKKG